MSIVKIHITPPGVVKVNGAVVNKVFVRTIGAQGPPGSGSAVSFVFNETPAGPVNGSNASFTSAYGFIPESVNVKINGLDQKPGMHFSTSGTHNISLNESPNTGEIILIDYIKS